MRIASPLRHGWLRLALASLVVALTTMSAGARAQEDAGVPGAAPATTRVSADAGAASASTDATDVTDAGESAPGTSGAPATDGGTGEPAAPTEPPVPPAPVARPLPEVLHPGALSELTTRSRVAIRDARSLLFRRAQERRIATELPRRQGDLKRREEGGELDRAIEMSRRELDELQQRWSREEQLFREWEDFLHDVSSELEARREAIVTLQTEWAGLETVAIGAEVPESLLTRIQTVIGDLRETEDRLRSRRDTVLVLADGVEAREDIIIQSLHRIAAAEEAFRGRLLERNAPPLHLAFGAGKPARAPDTGRHLRELRDLWSSDEDFAPKVIALLIAVPFLALAFVMIRRHAVPENRPECGRDETMVRLASRPFATAATTVLLFAPYAFPHAPVYVVDALQVLGLLPLVRVLPRFLGPSSRAVFYATLTLTLAVEAQALFLDAGLIQRLVVLAVSVATAVFAVVAEVPRIGIMHGAGASLRWSVRVGGALSAAAAVANVSGYTMFSGALTSGVIGSAHEAFNIFTIVLLIEATIGFAIAHRPIRLLPSVRDHASLIQRRANLAVRAIAVCLLAAAIINAFGLRDAVSTKVEGLLAKPLQIGDADLVLSDGLLFLAILAATIVLARFVRFALETDILPQLPLEQGLDGAISMMARYLIVSVGILLALASIGIDPQQLALVAGALSVGIGFGLQTIVSNFISGLILMFERPVRIGDFIEVGELVGAVTRIGVRSSTVRCLDGSEVIVPNEALISKEVVNWTLSDRRRRVEVCVGVAYGTDPARVTRILSEVARSNPDALSYPAPAVLFEAFGASSLDFTVQFWTPRFSDWRALRSEMTHRVHEALEAEGIEIPFPQQDLHVRSWAEDAKPPSP